MNEIRTITEKIDDCNTAIESLEQLITKHDLKPLRYAATFIKEEKAKAAKSLSMAKIDEMEVTHQEVAH